MGNEKLTPEDKSEIRQGLKEISEGKVVPLSQLENEDMLLTKEEMARAWLKAEKEEGFLSEVTLEEVLASVDLFDEIDEGHGKANAEAQLLKAQKHYEGEYERGRKNERERISAVCFKMERERRGQLPVELWQALREGIK